MHIQTSPELTTGPVGNTTVGFTGTHGETTIGTHGIGVRTPSFAAVAAATVGLDGVLHIPKVMIFIIGIKSEIETTGIPQAKTGVFGIIVNEEEATPNEHLHNAPQTATGINFL
jgi:uracil phosphoribosyltransferase